MRSGRRRIGRRVVRLTDSALSGSRDAEESLRVAMLKGRASLTGESREPARAVLYAGVTLVVGRATTTETVRRRTHRRRHAAPRVGVARHAGARTRQAAESAGSTRVRGGARPAGPRRVTTSGASARPTGGNRSAVPKAAALGSRRTGLTRKSVCTAGCVRRSRDTLAGGRAAPEAVRRRARDDAT